MEATKQVEEEVDQALPSAEEKPKKLIIVTGFGPFVGHELVNASWEAVRLLPDTFHFKNVEYVLEKQMIPVEYNAVDEAVHAIWARKPDLVIHCGVHGLTKCVLVEKRAYNNKFCRADYAGQRLQKGTAQLRSCVDGKKELFCGLNVNKIVDIVDQSCSCSSAYSTPHEKVVKASYDVGNYLCGYIYIKSLDINRERSLFVHVPPIGKPFSSAQTSAVILKITAECVRQLEEDMKDICGC